MMHKSNPLDSIPRKIDLHIQKVIPFIELQINYNLIGRLIHGDRDTLYRDNS